MEKFVKKYSDIPNSFIDDFYDMAKELYKNNELVISFDKIVKHHTVSDRCKMVRCY